MPVDTIAPSLCCVPIIHVCCPALPASVPPPPHAYPHLYPREVNAIIIIITTTVITLEIYINKPIISLSVTVRDPCSRAGSSAALHVHHARAWLSRDRTREHTSLSAALGSHGSASRTCATGRVCVRNVPLLLDNVPSLRHCLPC